MLIDSNNKDLINSGLLIKGQYWFNLDSTINCYSLRRDMHYNLEIFKKNSISLLSQCIDIVAYDEPGKYNRFTVVYILNSLCYNKRLYMYLQTSEVRGIDSVTNIFSSANWSEREIWDLFGIFFINHPDLRRLLSDYGFKGHPLRKDFPLTGYVELSFVETSSSVIYSKIELVQEYKNFIFMHSPNYFFI